MKRENEIIAADPFVLYDEVSGYYYCYSTNDAPNKAFSIHKSKDKDNWEFVNYALDLTHDNIWGRDWFWAPECYYNPNNKHYYLFYSARVKRELTEEYFIDHLYEEDAKIGVAISSSPEGPFINMSNRPMDFLPFDPDYLNVEYLTDKMFEMDNDDILANATKGNYIPCIDGNLLIEDNRIIMYFSRCCYMNCRYDKRFKRFIESSNVACVELNTDWWFDKEAKIEPTIKDEYKFIDKDGRRKDKFITLISYDLEPQEWENGHVDDYKVFNKARKNRRWSEGSTTFKTKFNGKECYALTYSCNCYEDKDYAVGIAFSDNALGPFKKYHANPIITDKNDVCSLGHGSLVIEDNEFYYFLHGRTVLENPRVFCYTKINVNDFEVNSEDIKVCKLI